MWSSFVHSVISMNIKYKTGLKEKSCVFLLKQWSGYRQVSFCEHKDSQNVFFGRNRHIPEISADVYLK